MDQRMELLFRDLAFLIELLFQKIRSEMGFLGLFTELFQKEVNMILFVIFKSS